MKKFFLLAAAALTMAGATYAHEGKKDCCAGKDKKECSKEEVAAKKQECSKDGATAGKSSCCQKKAKATAKAEDTKTETTKQ